MEDAVFDFLKRLTDAPSPSGFEQPAQRVWRAHVEPHVDELHTDVMGSSWGVLRGPDRPRVMLAGHVDEIGLMVRYIDDQGFLYFAPIGGVDAHLLPGQRVRVHGREGAVTGVVGRKPIHLLEHDERSKVAKIKDLCIDIGAAGRDEAEARVAVGDPVTFAFELERLGGDRVASRGLDDKMGSFVVAETLRRLAERKPDLGCTVYGVSTVQEEVGLRGARTSAFGIDPDVGICVEVTFATDHPGVDKKAVGDVQVGKGPVLSRGANINPRLFELLVDTARAEGIPVQFEAAPRATGTDANVMQLTRAGVATALVEVPLRYMHTPSEVLSLSDLDHAIQLLVAVLLRIGPDRDWIPQ
ncbi:M42 family metallopeptidase [Deferrisoma camini]|uniref:M42 family metallopeptidase n=1 Tax=Deferrisoma camini TaxID=1035120 RepID=UPI00046CEF98|nr:M42 family metallopeptidase [Deferrisoma camini]